MKLLEINLNLFLMTQWQPREQECLVKIEKVTPDISEEEYPVKTEDLATDISGQQLCYVVTVFLIFEKLMYRRKL